MMHKRTNAYVTAMHAADPTLRAYAGFLNDIPRDWTAACLDPTGVLLVREYVTDEVLISPHLESSLAWVEYLRVPTPWAAPADVVAFLDRVALPIGTVEYG